VQVYGTRTTDARGGTIALNFFDVRGGRIDHQEIERRAGAFRISLRTGCFCNPGAAETASGIGAERLSACLHRLEAADRLEPEALSQCLGSALGAVRVSLGVASNLQDVERFLAFAATLLEH
jgi:molybdenum cofactor sulfurtransferase